MIRKYLAVGIVLLGLSACVSPTIESFRVKNYADERAVILPAKIEVINQTGDFTTLPHIENNVPTTPVSALTTAIKNHFKSSPDATDKMTFTIEEASLIQKKAEDDRWYILDNMEYLLSYKITMTWQQGNHTESQEIVGWEKQTLPERSSIAKREHLWQTMIDAMTEKVLQKIENDLPAP